MNDYTVFVVKPGMFEEPQAKCVWLGHQRFRCGNCKKGYFNVKSKSKYDERCPECLYLVVIKYVGKQ